MYSLRIKLREPYRAQALLFDLSEGLLVEEILENAFKDQTGALESAAVIFFRLPVWRQISPKKTFDPACLFALGFSKLSHEEIYTRYRNRPVYVIGSWKHKYWIVGNINPTCHTSEFEFKKKNMSRLLKLIRHNEMDCLAEEGRSVMPEIAGSYYRSPSGSYQSAFLRVGNIQYSQFALDIVFFWLLPVLRRCSGVVTETWSIASIALNISRRLAIYRNIATNCFVEMLPGYYSSEDEENKYKSAEIFARLIASTKVQIPADGRVLFLMSAINTCALQKEVSKTIIPKFNENTLIFAAIFNLGKRRSKLFCLRDLSDEAQVERGVADKGRFSPIGQAPEPDDSFIDIDKRTYFPSQYKDIKHELRQPDANMPSNDGYLSFVKRYPLEGLIKVHKNVFGDTTQTHHSIWIDTCALIEQKVFRKRLLEILLKLEPKPRILVTPLHQAAGLLANYVIEAYANLGLEVIHIRHPNLFISDRTAPEHQGVLEAINDLDPMKEALLILDDAFISGRRLSRYQSHLRASSFEGVVHYVVGVVRCDDPAVWRDQVEMLKYRPRRWPLRGTDNSVNCVEQFVIPNWSTADCPWCAELRYYNKIARIRGSDVLPENIVNRRNFLRREARAGLSKGLFLAPEGFDTLTLRANSVFQTEVHTEAAFYGAVASAMQHHRSSGFTEFATLGKRRYPIATVLDYNQYLTTKMYTDGFIRACFLRAAKTYEIVYTSEETEKKKTAEIDHLISSMIFTDSEIGPEAVLAKSLGKFPKLSTESVQNIMAKMKALDLFRDLSAEEMDMLVKAELSPLPNLDD